MMQISTNKEVLPLLGIVTNCINQKVVKPKSKTAMEAKKLRYELQRTAQTLLYKFDSHKQHRTCGCQRNVASDGVSVWRTVDGKNARYGNLMSCGSVWSCPVCAAKITESRREDLQKAQSAWIKESGSCLLNTLTYPHEIDLPLEESLEKFSVALNYYKNSKTYKRIFGTSVASVVMRDKLSKPLKNIQEGEFPRLGTVRSLEVTHGVNGWHPHVHEVLFMNDEMLLEAKTTKDELTHAWVIALLKAGLGSREKMEDMYHYAWDIRGGDYVSDYINKFGREPIEVRGWTIAHEATKANSKMGKQGRKIGDDWHYTPFQLLGFATDGDEQAAALFKEFSKCFEGKRMNYWTNGLKDWFNINEIDDAELATDTASEPEEELVIRFNGEQWRDILATNTRAEVLHIAANNGLKGIEEFLEKLPALKKTHRGWFYDRIVPDMNRFYH